MGNQVQAAFGGNSTGALLTPVDDPRKKKKRKPGDPDRGRTTAGRGRRGAGILTSQQLGIANVGLKRLTGA